jgi:hypothetical protein
MATERMLGALKVRFAPAQVLKEKWSVRTKNDGHSPIKENGLSKPFHRLRCDIKQTPQRLVSLLENLVGLLAQEICRTPRAYCAIYAERPDHWLGPYILRS